VEADVVAGRNGWDLLKSPFIIAATDF